MGKDMDWLEELRLKGCGGSRRVVPRRREHDIQAACVRWFNLAYPRLRGRLFAVPNGGHRLRSTASALKAEGVVAGVSDLILLKPSKGFGALLIEMKTSEGRQSAAQEEWMRIVMSEGEYKYVICRSVEDFMKEVVNYLDKIK